MDYIVPHVIPIVGLAVIPYFYSSNLRDAAIGPTMYLIGLGIGKISEEKKRKKLEDIE